MGEKHRDAWYALAGLLIGLAGWAVTGRVVVGVVLFLIAGVIILLTSLDRMPRLKERPTPKTAPDIMWAAMGGGPVVFASFRNDGPPATFSARGKWFDRNELPNDIYHLLETDWPIRWRDDPGEKTRRVNTGAIGFLDLAETEFDEQQRRWWVRVITPTEKRIDRFSHVAHENAIRIELRSDLDDLPAYYWICFSLDPLNILSAHPCELDIPPIAEPLVINPPER